MASLPEISGLLREQHGVRQASTAVVHHDGRDLVVAVVEVADYQSGPALRDHVRRQLGPDALAGVLVVDTMPVHAGELDLDSVRAAIEDGRCALYEPPADDVESRLAAIWAGAMAVPSVGVHDDFLELGGDSLSALGIITAIETEFDQQLDVYEFMTASSVRRLADRLRVPVSPAGSERG